VARRRKECARAQEVRNVWDELCALYFAGRLPSLNAIKILPETPKDKEGRIIWATLHKHANGQHRLDFAEENFEIGSAHVYSTVLHELVHCAGIWRHNTEAWHQEVRRLSDLGALRHVL
jgi:hypothetical protein